MKLWWIAALALWCPAAQARDQAWFDEKTIGVEAMSGEESNDFWKESGIAPPKMPGLIVKSFRPAAGTPSADIDPGDLIVSVNGQKVADGGGLQAATEKLRAPGTTKVEVLKLAGKKYGTMKRQIDVAVRTRRQAAQDRVVLVDIPVVKRKMALLRGFDLSKVNDPGDILQPSFFVDQEGRSQPLQLCVLHVGIPLRMNKLVLTDGEKTLSIPVRAGISGKRKAHFSEIDTFTVKKAEAEFIASLLSASPNRRLTLQGEAGEFPVEPRGIQDMIDAYEAYGGKWPPED